MSYFNIATFVSMHLQWNYIIFAILEAPKENSFNSMMYLYKKLWSIGKHRSTILWDVCQAQACTPQIVFNIPGQYSNLAEAVILY